MKHIKLSSEDYQIFLLKSLLWTGLAWGAFTFALIGFFYASLIWLVFSLTIIWLIRKALESRVLLRISREMFFASITAMLVVVVFSFFSQPSVFTGRDQGSFSEAAARLAQNHQLKFSTPVSNEFFKLHESGRALNFPGFYYTKSGALITQFSLVYIAWLALFFAVFGTAGFIVANGLLLFTFFLSFYLALRLFMKTTSAAFVMMLVATSFGFMWFSKFTLSENMALPLVWVTILSLMLFLKNPKKLRYFVSLSSVFLLCFTRIEGFAFLIASIIIISLNKSAKEFVKENVTMRFFLPALILFAAFIANTYVDAYFYKEIIKALLPTITTPQASYLGEIKNNILPAFYTGKIFYLYGLLGFFIISGISIIFKLWKKEFYKLVPFFLTLPTYVYFFDSQISSDHPWMLRRFMFSLAPVAIFYTGLFLGRLFEISAQEKISVHAKRIAVLIFAILLTMNLPAFLKYVTHVENSGLLKQTQVLSSKFSDKDLILIDQQSSGDGWSMLAGPMSYLYGKNAVYFFNNNDLAKLDISEFSNVFLIASDQKVPFYKSSTLGEKLIQTDEYVFNTIRLESKKNSASGKISLPEKNEVFITGKIFRLSK